MHDAELNIGNSRFTVVGSRSHHNCKCGGFKLSFFIGGRHGIVLKVRAVCLLFLIQIIKVLLCGVVVVVVVIHAKAP